MSRWYSYPLRVHLCIMLSKLSSLHYKYVCICMCIAYVHVCNYVDMATYVAPFRNLAQPLMCSCAVLNRGREPFRTLKK